MTNRILLGTRSSGRTGLYVSKTSRDVLTCSDTDLLIDSDVRLPQVIFDATYSCDMIYHGQINAMRWIPHPNYGFIPLTQIDIISGMYYNGGRYALSPISLMPYEVAAGGFFILFLGSTGNNSAGYYTRPVTFRVRLYSLADYDPRGGLGAGYDSV